MTPYAQTMRAVAEFLAPHGVTLEQMQAQRRATHFIALRWEVYALLHERGWSTTRIARLFNRYHSSVVRGLRRRKELAA